MDRAGLAAAIPAIDWQVALEPSGLGAVPRVVVREVSAIKDGAALLDTEPVAAWKKYLAFHLADDATRRSPEGVRRRHFAFHSKALRGVEVQRERWKRGVALLDDLIGEGLGRALRRPATSRPGTRRRWTRSSPTCARPWASA